MKRIRLTISYDGTEYVGWQVQKNGLAVEQVINRHLSELLKEEITIIGASRTDSGVHALGNVAVFDTETRIPSGKIALALNQRLPEDIRIVRSEEAAPDFHPRYANCAKTYQYTVLNSRVNLPLLRRYADYVYYALDEEKMRAAAAYLIGEHDFEAFSSAGGQQKSSIRTIHSLTVETEELPFGNEMTFRPDPEYGEFRPRLFRITVCGNGFLYNMVRIIAGTLEKVGMGIYPPEYVKEILESRDRSLSAPKAPARGLTLVKIDYFP